MLGMDSMKTSVIEIIAENILSMGKWLNIQASKAHRNPNGHDQKNTSHSKSQLKSPMFNTRIRIKSC